MTFSLGLLTPGGDAEWISTLGIPGSLILFTGILLLFAGSGAAAYLLSLAGIGIHASTRYKIFVILTGMCSLMLIRFIFAFLNAPSLRTENFIPLVFSLLLAAIVILLQPHVIRLVREQSSTPQPLTWAAPIIAMMLGSAIFLIQIVVLVPSRNR